jgi:p21-activated kinase 1
MEISTAVTPPVQKYQGLISNVNLHAAAATDHNRPVILPRKAPPKPSTGRSQEHKSDFSSPLAPFSHGASKITVEYHKPSMQSIQEYQELLSNVNLHAAAADYNDPFIPPRKALPSTNSQNDSKPSRSQDHKSHDSSSPLAPSSRGASKRTVEYHKPSRQFIQEYQELLSNVNPHSAAAANNEKFFEDFVIPPRQAPPPVSSHNASKPSRSRDHDSSVSHHKSISVKNKGVLSRMTNLLHLNKRPEISTPRDPVHLTHGGFNTSTGQFTGLPEEWQQLLQGNIDDHDDGVSVWEHLLRPPQSRREK